MIVSLFSKTALTETLEIDQYMWAILNTLSGNQEVEDVVIDNAANWKAVRNSMNPSPMASSTMNANPAVTGIKVSLKFV